MTGQITIWEWLDSINPDCRNCRYEETDRWSGLSMCRHRLIMNVHYRTRGKFSAKYDKVDHPEWCPLVDPERWAPWDVKNDSG